MSFNPTIIYKIVDGVQVNLTAEEIVAYEAQQAVPATAPPDPVPDLATQLANILIAKGTIAPTDLNMTTLTAVNATLAAAKLPTIS